VGRSGKVEFSSNSGNKSNMKIIKKNFEVKCGSRTFSFAVFILKGIRVKEKVRVKK